MSDQDAISPVHVNMLSYTLFKEMIVDNNLSDFPFRNCFEITLELGCCKFPPALYIMPYWYANREALLKFIELVHKTGIRGFVVDEKGRPLEGARIIIENRAKKIKTFKDGDYWRLLVPGNYTVRVAKRRYKNSKKKVTVGSDVPTVVNFTLVRKRAKNFNRRRPAVKTNQGVELAKPASNVSFHSIATHRDKLRLSAKSPKKSASVARYSSTIGSFVCLALAAVLQ